MSQSQLRGHWVLCLKYTVAFVLGTYLPPPGQPRAYNGYSLLHNSEEGFSCLVVTVLVRKSLALKENPVNQEGKFHLNYVCIFRHRLKCILGIFR